MAVDRVKGMTSRGPCSPTAVPKALLERMRKKGLVRRKKGRAKDWSGQYGYGAGRTNPCVEFATCPHCGSLPGKLCTGAMGPTLSHHFRRGRVYRDLKRRAMDQLRATSAKGPEVGTGRRR